MKNLQHFLEQRPKYLFTGGISIISLIIFGVAYGPIRQYLRNKKQSGQIYVGIQLGGTNYHVAVGKPEFDRDNKLINFYLEKQQQGRVSNKPQQTINQIVETIQNNLMHNVKIDFIGISSFGPLQLHQGHQNYGSITSTPKQGWRNTPILKNIKQKLSSLQYAIQTDVNSAAFAQFTLGGHKAKQSLVYVTVGTGVGAGVVCHQKTVHGLTHPQGGHIRVTRHPKQYQNFQGVCPYHKSCLQGMVANHSISARTNVNFAKLHQIQDNHVVWQILGYYLAQLCINLTLIVSPQVIIIGGGILNRKNIYSYIHNHFLTMLAQYIQHPLFTAENINEYIKPPALGSDVGVKSAMLLKYLKIH